jgi:branched-chain amino acid transport system permease protein
VFWEQVFSGLVIGGFYALIALGFVLVYKATEVLNFAQGDLMMLGPFLAVTLITLKVPFVLALVLSVLLMGLLGLIIERSFLRSMVGQPLFSVVLATLAISIIIRSIAGICWGHELRGFPHIFSNVPFKVGGVAVSPSQIWAVAISLGLVILFYLFFQYTTVGISFRAASQNQLGSVYCGISVKRVFTMSWVLAAAVGAVGGILIAPTSMLQVEMGYMALNAFPAAILGGMESVPGAIVGGVILGVLQTLAGAYMADWIKKIFPWVILILILLIRPEGIFGVHKRKKV